MPDRLAGGALASFKIRFHNSNTELVARIANVRWSVEVLQRRCVDVLPESEASRFSASLQPILQRLDNAKENLLAADGKVEDVTVIQKEELANERY